MAEPLVHSSPHALIINEIFHSIQGESSHAGRPCVFIRLTYCNIRCSYCDSAYAFYEGKEMSIDSIIDIVRAHNCKLVEVTGGEPLFQANVHELMTRLCDDKFEVLLETGGSLDISGVDTRVKRIIDFKCPSSNMMKKNLWENATRLKEGDEVKFVIGDREDYEWAKEMIHQYELRNRCPILMSVVFGALDPVVLAEWILQDKLDVRFQLQMHKYIWSPETRGV
ncbi:MAG: radical SAM protein [Ignavibacteria bacterium]|nr:radical SAM protein [Ignavibacteria bacterium]MBI3766482.1 radical SAM protein [Ignavibacteriales bacterium]